MIKIKLQNPQVGRNEPTFRPFYFIKDMLSDYSIELTDSDDFDYLFIGMNDFIDKKLSLQDSIDWGLENLSNITGDYFLFEGSDSTSLMGGYEVFQHSNAHYLFKNQTLSSRHDYKIPYAHNKWFWGSGSDLDLSYDISEKMWNRIKLTGWNVGQLVPNYKNFQNLNPRKSIDICGIFQAKHDYNEDHKSRNDHLYTKHRKGLWDKLEHLKSKYNMIYDRLPFEEYIRNLWDSKISFSPFGMGEICFRDFECIQYGTIFIKPNQDIVRTLPNIYQAGETYIDVEYDWSNLEERIDYVLSDFKTINEMINTNVREKFIDGYDYNKLCLHWYNIFKNLDSVESE
tara:strand:+ start:1118 stop:2143 length:1026 start_codon:yes stop_codon:yes gene_type:complete